jgi:hypothetical protein
MNLAGSGLASNGTMTAMDSVGEGGSEVGRSPVRSGNVAHTGGCPISKRPTPIAIVDRAGVLIEHQLRRISDGSIIFRIMEPTLSLIY